MDNVHLDHSTPIVGQLVMHDGVQPEVISIMETGFHMG